MVNIDIKKANNANIHSIKYLGEISLPIYYNDLEILYMINNNEYQIYVANDNKKNIIIGFIIIKINKEKKNIHILSLAVNPEYRKMGIGTKLFNYLKDKFKKKIITLNVQISNINAINFYFKQLFKITNFFSNYYNNLEINSAYEMTYEPILN